jgi:two-component system LytT family sensor kinase
MVRSRLLGHLLFWAAFLATVMTYKALGASHGHLTPTGYLTALSQLNPWATVFRAMVTVYVSLWMFTRYAFPRQLALVFGQILLLCLFDSGLRILLKWHLLPLLSGHGPAPGDGPLQGIQEDLLASALFVMLAFVFKQLRDHQKSEALLHEKNAMELAYLKAQLNPHFLFNSMNNLYGLALTEPESTPDAILMLSQLMRYMLYESNADRVSLTQEVNYLNSYIALEKLRYEGAVHVDFTIEGDIEGLQIAPLLLICFVENAFKHGTVSNPDQPVQLHLAVRAGHLTFTTRNQIVAKNKDLAGGVGLPSVRRRLALLYPQHHQLTITSEHGRYCCVLELDAQQLAPLRPLPTLTEPVPA